MQMHGFRILGIVLCHAVLCHAVLCHAVLCLLSCAIGQSARQRLHDLVAMQHDGLL